jgi:hypothetical protein
MGFYWSEVRGARQRALGDLPLHPFRRGTKKQGGKQFTAGKTDVSVQQSAIGKEKKKVHGWKYRDQSGKLEARDRRSAQPVAAGAASLIKDET